MYVHVRMYVHAEREITAIRIYSVDVELALYIVLIHVHTLHTTHCANTCTYIALIHVHVHCATYIQWVYVMTP